MTLELALFPLQTVLFPGGLLGLKVFEARYLDLVGRCLREGQSFGVVALRQGGEVNRRGGATVELEDAGVLAHVLDVDAAGPGILRVRCRGTQRFELLGSRQQADGLWLADTAPIEDDPHVAPTAALAGCARGLADAIAALGERGSVPFLEPYRFDDAGWVANRWCELLPVPLAAKHKLMRLPDPLLRLTLVDEYLRGKGVLA
ncbi:MAG TPA: LON peptidase substrate-binding domain-containing protein [Ideonella sp.]|nr:LON peptidase substrate-binding domain-containing protein [Ideonella sp.]